MIDPVAEIDPALVTDRESGIAQRPCPAAPVIDPVAEIDPALVTGRADPDDRASGIAPFSYLRDPALGTVKIGWPTACDRAIGPDVRDTDLDCPVTDLDARVIARGGPDTDTAGTIAGMATMDIGIMVGGTDLGVRRTVGVIGGTAIPTFPPLD